MLEKELLFPEDFSNQCKNLSKHFWTQGISFYLVVLLSSTKKIPAPNSKIYRRRTRRKRIQGLKPPCCAKIKKERTGERVTKFIVVVSHSKVIVKCYQCIERINGEKFVNFID